jgi:hypothetical protein
MSWSSQWEWSLCGGFGHVGFALVPRQSTRPPRLMIKDRFRGFDRAQNPIRQSTA